MQKNGDLTTCEASRQARWQEHFCETFHGTVVSDISKLSTQPSIKYPATHINSTPQRVFKAISALPRGKAVGRDLVPAEVLQAGKFQAALLVSNLTTQIISNQTAPVDCKGGRIADVYKGKGNPAVCNHSRGILVQDHIGKVVSNVLKDQVTDKYNHHMPDSQHGCVSGKSTDLATHLVRSLIDMAAHSNMSVFVLFVDLEKAFDRIVRELVLGFPQGMIGDRSDYLAGIGLGPEHVQFVCEYISTHKPIFAQWGIDDAVIETIKSLHANSFYAYGTLDSVIMAPRGGRQGCTFGAMIFNAVYAVALVEVHKALTLAGVTFKVVQGKETPWSNRDAQCPCSAEAVDATYVDDEAFVLLAKSPKLLDVAINVLLESLTTVFSKFCLDINWGRGKTEAMLKYRGRHATKLFEQRRDEQGLHIGLPASCVGQRLHVVDRYKHLGGIVAICGTIMYEVQQRCANALVAYTPLAGNVFGSPIFRPWLKFHLCSSLVMSRLMYNVHTLVMTPAAIAKLSAVYMRVLRRIADKCRYKASENVSDSMLLVTLGKPSMDCLLVRARLSYLRRVCRHPSQALFLLLTGRVNGKPLPWVAQLISDLTILRKSAELHKTKLPGENAPLLEWLSLFDTSSAWGDAVAGIYFTHSCNDKVSSSGPSTQAHQYVCDICTASENGLRPSFATSRALESHKRSKHKQLSEFRFYVDADGKCPVCHTTFNSRIRCLAHLSDRRRTKCAGQIRAGIFCKIPEATVLQLDLADREARREAQRSGHSHPLAQKPATRHDGRVTGRVVK